MGCIERIDHIALGVSVTSEPSCDRSGGRSIEGDLWCLGLLHWYAWPLFGVADLQGPFFQVKRFSLQSGILYGCNLMFHNRSQIVY